MIELGAPEVTGLAIEAAGEAVPPTAMLAGLGVRLWRPPLLLMRTPPSVAALMALVGRDERPMAPALVSRLMPAKGPRTYLCGHVLKRDKSEKISLHSNTISIPSNQDKR